MKYKIIINLIFATSILLNFIFLVDYLNRPTYQLGILKRDLNIMSFYDDTKVIFKIPKGMVVMDNSPQGIMAAGVFSANRISFSIMVDKNWIDYSQSIHLNNHQSLYESSESNH